MGSLAEHFMTVSEDVRLAVVRSWLTAGTMESDNVTMPLHLELSAVLLDPAGHPVHPYMHNPKTD
jgi:hypothetical protein